MNDAPTDAAGGRGGEVLDALAARPGGPQLLALSADRDDVALVGGAVRDLLRGRAPRELDVVVAAGSAGLAAELGDKLGARVTVHERFGTAVVEWEAGRIDIAQRRAESYSAPGALPDVRPGTVAEDLARRDFTVNAIAVPLDGASPIELHAAEHALEDLADGRLRVLHARSFVDDPTRLLRLARYRARLGFEPEADTAELAAQAVAAGAPATVSHARIGAELRLALAERDAVAALEAVDELGLLAAVHPQMRFDEALARAGLESLAVAVPAVGRLLRADLLLLATLLHPLATGPDGKLQTDIYTLLNSLEFPAADRDIAIYDAMSVEATARRLDRAESPSKIYEAASHLSPEGIALAGAWGRERGGLPRADAAARDWLAGLHNVNLQITGEDLLAAGIPEGPEIRRRLEAALLRKLDGELAAEGREAELQRRPRGARVSERELCFELPGGARALFTTRASGNLSTLAGEDHEDGLRRRAEMCERLGLRWLCASRQIHGTDVHVARRLERAGGAPVPIDADGHATTLRELGTMVLTADCLPVALGAPGAVAMVHAGWRGLAAGVLEEGVRTVRELAGEDERIVAIVGPGAGPCCYEVGAEVHEALAHAHARGRDRRIDLRGIARERLERAGVRRVREVELCTICDARFFSHRREGARAGRQAGVAWLS